MYNTELAKGHLFSDEMNVKLYVFRPPMMNQISGHVHGEDIIAGDGGLRLRDGELTKQLPQPYTISDHIRQGAVFCFCTGSRDDDLSLLEDQLTIVSPRYTQ